MPNLIVILFNLTYPAFCVRFHCMSYMWERVWRLKATLKIKGVFAGILREDFQQSEAMCTAHNWNAKSHDSWFSWVFCGQGLLMRYPRNILFCYFGISAPLCLHPHYIYLHYSHIGMSAFREKTLAITFES